MCLKAKQIPTESGQQQRHFFANSLRFLFYIMAYTLASWLGRLFDAGKSLLPLQSNYINALLEQELPGEREGTLTVRDDRTGSKYTIPIVRNSVPAMGFRQICVDRAGKSPRQQFEDGLRLIDPGYRNTAVKMSSITYMCVLLFLLLVFPPLDSLWFC